MVKGNLIAESPLDLTMVSIADVTGSFWGSPFNEHPERNSSVKMSRWFFDKDTEKSSYVGCIDIKKESCNNSLSKPPLDYFHVYGCYYQVPCEPRFFFCYSDHPGFVQVIWLRYFVPPLSASLVLMVLFSMHSSTWLKKKGAI